MNFCLVWFTDTHLGCEGTTSKNLHGLIIYLQSTCYLSSIYRSMICLSMYPFIFIYLSVYLYIYHFYLPLSIYQSSFYYILSIYHCLSFSFYLSKSMYLYYTFVSTLYVSRHHLSIHLSSSHLSINALRRIIYLSTCLSIYPTTIYHISIIYILIYH